MNEAQAVSRFLFERLAAAPAVTALVGTRLYEAVGPQSGQEALPCVLWSYSSAEVTAAAGADRRVLMVCRYVIEARAEGGSFAEADAIAAAVDGALEGLAGSITWALQSYWVALAQQEQPIRLVEVGSGRRVHRSGGIYRILAHSLP